MVLPSWATMADWNCWTTWRIAATSVSCAVSAAPTGAVRQATAKARARAGSSGRMTSPKKFDATIGSPRVTVQRNAPGRARLAVNRWLSLGGGQFGIRACGALRSRACLDALHVGHDLGQL